MNDTEFLLGSLIIQASATPIAAGGHIIDHRHPVLSGIPMASMSPARDSLHVAYGHTSHRSQLRSGNGSGASGRNKDRGVANAFSTSPEGSAGTRHLLEGSDYTEGSDLLGRPDHRFLFLGR